MSTSGQQSLTPFRTMTIIHSENVLLENIYVNSTDLEHPVEFDFSSLNVRHQVSTTRSAEMSKY